MDGLILSGLVAIFALTLLVTRQQRGVTPGMYRAYFMIGGSALLTLAYVPNVWLQLLIAYLLVNALRDRMLGAHLSRLYPMVVLVMAGALILPSLTHEHIPILLGAMALGGCVLAVQAAFYAYERRTIKGVWSVALTAGQENVNNTQSISVVCGCAAIGLAVQYSPWWWPVAAVALSPMLFTTWVDWATHRAVTMGPVLLVGVGLMALPLWIGWWSAFLVPVVLVGLALAVMQAFRREHWWDSGRIRCWYTMLLTGWWLHGWTVRLCGRGWQSWLSYNDFIIDVARKTNRQHIVNTRFMMSTAHNEFVQTLFEHGAIGLVLLCGYVLTALWQLGHSEGQAVYIAAVAMCGVACTLHPWTWTHGTLSEVDEKGNPVKDGSGMKLYTIGSPALNWLAFMLALLVEVAR